MGDSYYFKHDSNAREKPKIKALIKKYGIEGYGRFWIIIEALRNDSTYKLENKPYNWLALAESMQASVEEVQDFMNDCVVEFELFVKEDGFFYSESFLEKMAKLDDVRKKRVYAANVMHDNRREAKFKEEIEKDWDG